MLPRAVLMVGVDCAQVAAARALAQLVWHR